ncbi:hypothetical protein EVAR_73641_1 [Eumeta japonica]|uniref:Uncharacterized protein n=1 Tax=Eumeta variegata TaxID=151549 RepID=A0A4C1TCI0_EUMVA|nr:hypothetical protein EVAR_73641_1 [Eumeta japonica]
MTHILGFDLVEPKYELKKFTLRARGRSHGLKYTLCAWHLVSRRCPAVCQAVIGRADDSPPPILPPALLRAAYDPDQYRPRN